MRFPTSYIYHNQPDIISFKDIYDFIFHGIEVLC